MLRSFECTVEHQPFSSKQMVVNLATNRSSVYVRHLYTQDMKCNNNRKEDNEKEEGREERG